LTRTALFVRWLLGIVAAIFLALGVAFLAIPTNMLGAMDIQAEPGKALADIRAVYGGLDLAIGILMAICFFRKQFSSGLGIGALALTCMFSGRLIGILIDPAQDVLTIGLFVSEVLGAVLCGVALFLARQPEPEPVAAAAPEVSVQPSTHAQPVVDASTPNDTEANP
jgi:hypothetical protein